MLALVEQVAAVKVEDMQLQQELPSTQSLELLIQVVVVAVQLGRDQAQMVQQVALELLSFGTQTNKGEI